jgi:hypothetical protein
MNDNAIDIAALAAYAGTYQQALFSQLYNNFDAVKDLTFWPGVKNTEKMTRLNIKHGAKPFTGNFKPKNGDLQYTGLDLVVQPWQRDLLIKPSDYRNTFMGVNRGKGENPNNKNIPFAPYVWGEVIKALAAGFNDISIFFGLGAAAYTAYNAGTVYNPNDKISYVGIDGETGYFRCNTLTVAGQSPLTNPEKWDDNNLQAIMVGFGSIIKALVTAGGPNGLTPFVTGAITSASDAYAIQKGLWRSLPIAVQNQGGVIFQSYNDFWLLADSYENQISKYTELDVSTGIYYLAGTNRKCVVKPATWMTGTRRLIGTTTDNMILATDELSDFNTIATEEHVYTLDAAMSGVIGVQIKDPSRMVVSDQL